MKDKTHKKYKIKVKTLNMFIEEGFCRYLNWFTILEMKVIFVWMLNIYYIIFMNIDCP